MRLDFYTDAELETIVRRGARICAPIADSGAREIARRSRGTPRVAGRLLRRVRDFAAADGTEAITDALADKALLALEVDAHGLDTLDRRYLSVIAGNFGGGPVGIETISAALSEPRDAIEDIVEPYLIQQGFVQRTPRGRLLTPKAFAHLGLAAPPSPGAAQVSLFADASTFSALPLHWNGCRESLIISLTPSRECDMKTEREKAEGMLRRSASRRVRGSPRPTMRAKTRSPSRKTGRRRSPTAGWRSGLA